MKRVIFDCALFLSFLLLPWWVTVPIAFAGMFIFPSFYEFIAIAILMHVLFAIPGTRVIASPVWFPLIVAGIYFGVQMLRQSIILYNKP